jgi:predicted nucleic acid-binding protein
MRVVADANVLVSAALARSPQAPSVPTLDAVLDGRLQLIISPQLLREIAMVLARPRLRRYLPPRRRFGSSATWPLRRR